MTLAHIGERIAELREAKLLKQSELAERAGISPSTLSQIESGRVPKPHIGTLRKIARALEAAPQDLTTPFFSGSPSAGSVAEQPASIKRSYDDAMSAMKRLRDDVEASGNTSLARRVDEAMEQIGRARTGEDDAVQHATEAS